jgi:hypothetical protein
MFCTNALIPGMRVNAGRSSWTMASALGRSPRDFSVTNSRPLLVKSDGRRACNQQQACNGEQNAARSRHRARTVEVLVDSRAQGRRVDGVFRLCRIPAAAAA